MANLNLVLLPILIAVGHGILAAWSIGLIPQEFDTSRAATVLFTASSAEPPR